MKKKPASTPPAKRAESREERLKKALRANLRRRKDQSRARGDETTKRDRADG